MSRTKLFLENFFAYGFINVLNKIIPILLLPVITRMLTDPSDFGIYDMYNLIIGFGSPLAMLGMYDAMFREFFEKDDEQYRYDVTSTANRIVLVTSTLMSSLLLIFNNSFSELFFGTSQYGNIVILSSLAMFISANSSIIAAPTRIQNQRKIYITSGLLSSISYYLLAIGLIYYGYSYLGMIYANIITSVILLMFFWYLNKKYFLLGKYDKKIAKELFKVGLPLLPTFLIYWVYNSMDKIMITNMLGTTELGIYSIGAKLASVSQLIYTAFAGGWQYFAFSTMKDNDYKYMIGRVWEYLFIASTCFFVGIFMFKDLIFNILFDGTYVNGVIVFPYLMFAPFLLMFYQILATQFQIIKKTYFSPLLLSTGAVVNLIFNIYLIPRIGIKGAAIATLLGYLVTLIATLIFVVNIKKMVIFNNKVVLMMIVFMIIFIFINYYCVNFNTILLCLGYLALSIGLYYKDVLKLIKNRV